MTHADPRIAPIRVACLSTAEPTAAALAQLIAALLPGAAVDATDLGSVRNLPDADCALIDASAEDKAIEMLRTMRARGFKAPAMLIVSGGRESLERDRARLGISHVLDSATLAGTLPDALREALRLDGLAKENASLAHALRVLRQTQRLLAAGEIALKLQHSLNNPLAALLAEAQLMELEDLGADHRRSVERIIELSRRLIEVTRSLEGIGGSRP
ncbi:MAG: hypothetical protein MNPFHGCM_01841 [Gemmatimonadaceae bacterium]|nr:hypothetical protein [Gemmatimonadaceae bacterium]